jgi:hypothetical protein
VAVVCISHCISYGISPLAHLYFALTDMDLVLSYFRAFFDRLRASLLGSLSSGVRSSKRRQAPLALTFRSQQKYLEIILKSTILDLYYK